MTVAICGVIVVFLNSLHIDFTKYWHINLLTNTWLAFTLPYCVFSFYLSVLAFSATFSTTDQMATDETRFRLIATTDPSCSYADLDKWLKVRLFHIMPLISWIITDIRQKKPISAEAFIRAIAIISDNFFLFNSLLVIYRSPEHSFKCAALSTGIETHTTRTHTRTACLPSIHCVCVCVWAAIMANR